MKRLTVITLQRAFMHSTLLLAVPGYILHILIGRKGNVGQLLLVIHTLFGLNFFKTEMVS